MKAFSRQEILSVIVIFFVLFLVSVPNFTVAWQRSRDVTRKDDLGFMLKALDSFINNSNSFPLGTDAGEIIACFKDGEDPEYDDMGNIINFVPCRWGEGSFLGNLPNDPQEDKGMTYFYVSNGRRYQIFGSLERTDQDEYDPKVAARKIGCGARICNFGRAYSNTPLDKTLTEYENEMDAKK